MTARLSSTTDTDNLYERDYYLWLSHTARLISEGKFDEVDTANLIEEIEDMGRSEKRAVESNLTVLLAHLLKYKYQPQKRSNSWRATIIEHRRRIKKAFRDSPSLKQYFSDIFEEAYQDAIRAAAAETGLNLDTFPFESPFTPEQVLNPDYLPA
jgi:hypothetical protein